jgi:hypothetical protein
MMPNKLTLSFLNINNLSNKAPLINSFVRSHCIDYMLLAETWLRHQVSPGLHHVIADARKPPRQHGRGRGVSGGILASASSPSLFNNCSNVNIDPASNWIRFSIESLDIIVAYLPPSLPIQEVLDFFHLMNTLATQNPNLIIIGDFNARMPGITGDKHSNSRGKAVNAFLNTSHLRYIAPASGLWTTFTHNGKSITDLVFIPQTSNLQISIQVLEEESIGGSDHRPLLISISESVPPAPPPRRRWIMHNLPSEYQRYQAILHDTSDPILNMLQNTEVMINDYRQSQLPISHVTRQNLVNQVWISIRDWTFSALDIVIPFNPPPPPTPSTPHYHWHQSYIRVRIAQRAAERASRNGEPQATVKRLWREYGVLSKAWTRQLKLQSLHTNNSHSDNICKDRTFSSFMKNISTNRRHSSSKTNNLDPTSMQTHVEYFKTTFGHAPTGSNSEINFDTLNSTDPRQPLPLPPEPPDLTPAVVSNILQRTSNSKTPGTDNLPYEVWKYGGEIMLQTLTRFFIMCETLLLIPSEWLLASIALVYKHKGDSSSIENYRPIALTCSIRRLFEQCFSRLLRDALYRQLSSTQGGFWPNKSTIDHIALTHELLTRNPKAAFILLDIKAAYDCVDRRILWTALGQHFHIPNHVITILRTLFDFNSSTLLIKGHTSPPIMNVRGLFQGSHLSPLLFTVFIDSLLRLLTSQSRTGLKLGDSRYNHLFYADDGTIFASSVRQASALLSVIEDWSRRNGLIFAPLKCAVLFKGLRRAALTLFDTPLPVVTSVKHLGIFFHKSGIDWTSTISHRVAATKKAFHYFYYNGMSLQHWRPIQCLYVYKTYLRPILEYGLALTILSNTALLKLQQTQNYILRRILSVYKSTSQAALHTIFTIEPIFLRNQILHYRYIASVFEGPKRSHPVGVSMLALFNTPLELSPKKSISYQFLTNSFWHRSYNNTTATFISLSRASITSACRQRFVDFQMSGGRVASSLVPLTSFSPTYLFRFCHLIPRPLLRVILYWQLGRLAYHQPCPVCTPVIEVSRVHAISCSGIDVRLLYLLHCLRHQYPDIIAPASFNLVDTYLYYCGSLSRPPISLFIDLGKLLLVVWRHLHPDPVVGP